MVSHLPDSNNRFMPYKGKYSAWQKRNTSHGYKDAAYAARYRPHASPLRQSSHGGSPQLRLLPNYREKVRQAHPAMADFLAFLGVDVEKAFETSPLEPAENGILSYCACQYLVFGACGADYQRQIGDVLFRVATSYPAPKVHGPYFVLECGPICLPLKAPRA